MRVVCVVGASGAGKTTLIERLVAQPALADARVGLVKRTHHRLDWHPPGKDSTRFHDTRAAAIAVIDPVQAACFWRRAEHGEHDEHDDPGAGRRATRELAAACLMMGDAVDLVLAEGFARSAAPKLWVTRNAPSSDRRGPPPVTRLIVTTPEDVEAWAHDFPDLDVAARDDFERIADRAREHAIDVRRLTQRKT